MPASLTELTNAKEAAARLLEQLGLEAYLFEIEPGEERWHLQVECAIDGGWQSTTLPVDKALLLASREDTAAQNQLLAQWRERLAACTGCRAQ